MTHARIDVVSQQFMNQF